MNHRRPSARRLSACVVGAAVLTFGMLAPVGAEGPAAGGTITVAARVCDAPPVSPLDCGPAASIGALTLTPADGSANTLSTDDATVMADALSWGADQPVPYDLYLIDTTDLHVPDGFVLSDMVPGNDTDAGGSEQGWYVNLTPDLPWATVYAVITPESAPDTGDDDGDGLTNHDENTVYGTDRYTADTDGDGADDKAEVSFGSDPLDPASFPAVQAGPEPVDLDSDGDGAPDSHEDAFGSDPFDPASFPAVQAGPDNGPSAGPSDADDSDGDGAGDATEVKAGTDPYDAGSFPAVQAGPESANDGADSDGDTIGDADEINVYGSDPNNPDTDGDGASDYAEIWAGSNPSDSQSWPEIQASQNGGPSAGPSDDDDSDGDGYGDLTETQADSDPYDPTSVPYDGDADGDTISNLDEVNIYGTDPNDPDTDGDGASDYAEIFAGSDPLDDQDFPGVQAGPEPSTAPSGTSAPPPVVALPNTGTGASSVTTTASYATMLLTLASASIVAAGFASLRRRNRRVAR